jgi:predicted RNA-binding protein with PUA-like domain
MAHWLIKSEPEVYSWDQLLKDKQTRWDGIRNYAARLHLRSMKKGDEIFFYHSNKGTEIVGIATVAKEAYPDPTSDDPAWFAIDIKPLKKLLKPVSLDQIKKEKKLSGMALVRISRLSVQPVKDDEWEMIMKMGGMESKR